MHFKNLETEKNEIDEICWYCIGEFEMVEERWRKDEILAAKIKKFLSVSCLPLACNKPGADWC